MVFMGWPMGGKKKLQKKHAPRPTKTPKYTIVEKDKEACTKVEASPKPNEVEDVKFYVESL
jgi:hypothetical protein